MTFGAPPLAQDLPSGSTSHYMQTRTLVVATFLVAACSDSLGPVPAGTFGLVSGGFQHTCGILGSGAAYCWGFNGSLQLGTGAANDRDTLPRLVAGGLVFAHIDAGQGHTCGITRAGAAYCWGSGSNDGALGNDTVDVTPVPVPVDGGLRFKAITLGWTHTCGLTTVGEAYCWGNNDFGKLGADSTVVSVRTPVPVAGGRTYTAIAAGDYHTCAIAVGGAAYCWGANDFGALGSGDSASHSTPTAVAGGHLFQAIDGGNVHTCGLTTGGDVYCRRSASEPTTRARSPSAAHCTAGAAMAPPSSVAPPARRAPTAPGRPTTSLAPAHPSWRPGARSSALCLPVVSTRAPWGQAGARTAGAATTTVRSAMGRREPAWSP